jgi:hypothetical protein
MAARILEPEENSGIAMLAACPASVFPRET